MILMNKTPKLGVYISKHGKLKVLSVARNAIGAQFWVIDQGIRRPSPILGISVNIVHEASIGWPLEKDFLKYCEYLGEL